MKKPIPPGVSLNGSPDQTTNKHMNIDSPQYPSAGVKSTLFKIDDQTSKTIDYT